MREKERARADIIEIDLKKLLLAYLRRWWVILLCGILMGGGVLIYTVQGITPVYRAAVMVYVNNSKNNQEIDYMTDSNLNASQKLVATYTTIANSSRVLDEASKLLNYDYSADDLREIISTAQVDNTGIFEIAVLHSIPEESQRIANAMADVVPRVIAEIVDGSSASVIDYAKLPDHRYSPSYTKNTALGILVGCFAAVVYLTLRSIMDVRIKDEKDLADVSPYPVLGLIPDFAQSVDRSRSRRNSHEHMEDPAALGQAEWRSRG